MKVDRLAEILNIEQMTQEQIVEYELACQQMLADKDPTQLLWFGKKHNEESKQLLRDWHINRPPEWIQNVSVSVSKSYQKNPSLKNKRSETFKENWKNNKEKMSAIARKNGNHGHFGSLNHNSKSIEYKGIIYYGWRELKEQTGISKDLYKSYYEKGLDPSPRIGKNGPPPKGFSPQKI
jgi:hypothetical protein